MKWGARIFGALAALLILYLGVGALLPGTWDARTDTLLSSAPEEVFPYLDTPELWIKWNTVPAAGLTFDGPARGPGAGFHWNDSQYGSGSFVVAETEPYSRVAYEVAVEGGSLSVQGRLDLETEDGGTRIRWMEHGDFGRNPLLGYAARGMASTQAEAMRSGLETLRELLEGTGKD